MIENPVAVLAVLLGILAGLFGMARHPLAARFFRVVPLLLFVYFVPTTLSNLGVLPLRSPCYDWIKTWLLPAALLLLTMSIDVPGILRLGPKVLILFLAGTAGIVFGGPVAYLLFGWTIPEPLQSEAWRGLAALSGSWIGGGANFVAIGESVGAQESTLGMMVVVDVALANIWMAVLLILAGHSRRLDAAVGADRTALEALGRRTEEFQKTTQRSATVAELCTMLFLAFGSAAIAAQSADWLTSKAESWLSPIRPLSAGLGAVEFYAGAVWVDRGPGDDDRCADLLLAVAAAGRGRRQSHRIGVSVPAGRQHRCQSGIRQGPGDARPAGHRGSLAGRARGHSVVALVGAEGTLVLHGGRFPGEYWRSCLGTDRCGSV